MVDNGDLMGFSMSNLMVIVVMVSIMVIERIFSGHIVDIILVNDGQLWSVRVNNCQMWLLEIICWLFNGCLMVIVMVIQRFCNGYYHGNLMVI